MSDDKLAAFRAFSFEDNSKWTDYFSRLELVSDSESALLKLKGKWYKNNVDPEFDVSLLAPAPPPPPATSRAQYTPPPTSAASGAQSARPAYKPAPIPSPLPRNSARENRGLQALALAHLMILLLAALFVVSLVLARAWSTRLFRLHCQIAALAHAWKLYQRCGLPTLRPFNWPAFQAWATYALTAPDFHYLMVSILFMMQPPVPTILLSPTVLALYHFAAYAKRMLGETPRWKALVEAPYAQLMARRGTALQVNAMSEVVSGFLLIVSAVFSRALLLPFVYFNMLRSLYANPESAPYHRQAWEQIGHYVNPLLAKVPALERPVAWVKDWFLKPSRPA